MRGPELSLEQQKAVTLAWPELQLWPSCPQLSRPRLCATGDRALPARSGVGSLRCLSNNGVVVVAAGAVVSVVLRQLGGGVLWWKWATKPHVDAPGPPTLPIIGNILEFLEMPVTLRKMFDLHRRYGDLTRLYLGPMLVVLVAHPDDAQHILLTSKLVDRRSFGTNAMRTFVGDGLVTLDAGRWRVHRKLINPTFHSEILEGFLEAFHDGGLFVSERLARTGGAVTEVHPPVFLAAIRNFSSTVIGMDPDHLMPDALAEEEISAAMNDGLTTVQKMIVRPWMQNKILLKLTSKVRENTGELGHAVHRH
ncbi:cytochrome P450 4C1-like [Schistocerca piceifrons]|uniref:cytochrome P450 4C1-like n=1 Tax=Schistocerca piceifrons TaxID=274613 RepID=UPI001F5EC27E|nr:cytochrome P450 4C1-like [Schistocerca piceifrons]